MVVLSQIHTFRLTAEALLLCLTYPGNNTPALRIATRNGARSAGLHSPGLQRTCPPTCLPKPVSGAIPLRPHGTALVHTAGNVGQVLGPLLAGVLLSTGGGYSLAYGTDAVLFTVALYAAFRLPPLPRREASESPGLRSVCEGLRFLSGNPVVLMSFAVDVAAMSPAMPEALFPQAAAERFHEGVGPLYAAIAVGSAGAAGFARTLWTAVALLVLAGAADLVSAVYRQTILQAYVPDRMRGRLQGVHTVVAVRPFWRYEAEAGGRVPT
ncbi:MFS transporter [Streptomyces sp. NPDC127072]|uniref:MFS transporter n=1 Tax=Streptomyces sp. NPDC127072 TaxID=3347129 RepID=UPI00365FF05F